MSMTIQILKGLSEVADRFDGFILDLWGVVHDGNTAYPGAADTLQALKAAGKKTILLSNAPRRGTVLTEMMLKMGIPADAYGDVMSSGEAVHQDMLTRRDPFFAKLGRTFFHIGAKRDYSVFEGLDYERVDDPAAATWVLNTGTEGFDESLSDFYRDQLDGCLAAGPLPMVCANPDIVVVRDGRRIICAGVLADYYKERGGEVVYRGKPDPAIYALCLERLGLPKERVAGVGDAFHTDVAGARGIGISSILVSGGIHREELGAAWGHPPSPDRLTQVIDAHGGFYPDIVLPAFRW